ncbi:hypothetical protein KM043_000374 [Ampulex compressa]|uniref:lysozyme n=1 Tax=Ampulex compressa TaxID=860918 RepID=A0A1W6EW63_AMPCP|nr:lysozyme c-1-like protein [Ampulex compressa]KAG7206700.1 hypothetical protein KM043_000374 [Ampulex compressa]
MRLLWPLVCLLLALLGDRSAEGKELTVCEAVRELAKARISRSLFSNWVCLMQSSSSLRTDLVTGPKGASSYSYGILQIGSGKWCARGRVGGTCNKRCEDFIDNDIQDDIQCAKKILDSEGFKYWPEWTKKCKNKPLPAVGHCARRR